MGAAEKREEFLVYGCVPSRLSGEYRGRKVQQANVVYVALEGRNGIPARFEAFKIKHEVNEAPFHLVTQPLNLASDADALIASIKTQMGNKPIGVVCLDTLNRSLVGSESKDEDMSAYIAAAGKIEEAFNCFVGIVHHCGVDATRPRGHTSLTGAVEVQLAVKKSEDGVVTVTLERAKDLEEGAEIFSKLEQVEVGIDPDGDPITSLVVVPSEAAPIVSTKLSKNQQTMYSILHTAGAAGLMTEDWYAKTKAAGVGTKRHADLYDIREALRGKHLVHEFGGRWNITK